MEEKLKKYLLSEESHSFKGWDFSYLDGRWESEEFQKEAMPSLLEFMRKKRQWVF